MAQATFIVIIDLPDGTSLHYIYGKSRPILSPPSAPGRLNQLSGVTRRDGQGQILWSRSYRYESPHNTIGLTAILDSAGAAISNYEYAPNGDARVTEKAGGVERYEVVSKENFYFPELTFRYVTNPLGHTERMVYAHTPITNKLYDKTRPNRLIEVSSSGSDTVPAFQKSYGYQTNSQMEAMTSATDARGFATTLTPDILGRPVSITNAAGTADEQKTDIVWHPQWDKPTRVTVDSTATVPTAGLETNFAYEPNGALSSLSEKDLATGETRTTTIQNDGEGHVLAVN